MTTVSTLALANEFLVRRASDSYPPQMLIQKLVFNAQGWNLAINHLPLVDEQALAWDNGPVYRSIWDHVKKYGWGRDLCQLTNPTTGKPYRAELSATQSRVVQETWDKYKDFSAYELSQMTHRPGTPWTLAYFGRGRNAGIRNSDMESYYTQLALAGRG